MKELQSARISTAGAYVCIDGCYLFALGLRPHNGQIPIIRLGGHREKNETGWQCAVREVHEEANLQIKPLLPHTTYVSEWDDLTRDFREVQWQHVTGQEPAPFLVVTYRRENETSLSLMYLACAEGIPTPSSEVKGLLLLEEQEIHELCRESLTLEQYLRRGGKALFNAQFDGRLVLEPFAQLRLLSKILSVQSANRMLAGDT